MSAAQERSPHAHFATLENKSTAQRLAKAKFTYYTDMGDSEKGGARHRDSFPALSKWMESDPDHETCIFCRFAKLIAQNLTGPTESASRNERSAGRVG
ncbi:hypothetical protein Vi05172_g9547 [Venturia inaequalis]|nr:hypothetical protein Vi05172_g9547 [Venturia inaequalis]